MFELHEIVSFLVASHTGFTSWTASKVNEFFGKALFLPHNELGGISEVGAADGISVAHSVSCG
jgi:hypothetical protein